MCCWEGTSRRKRAPSCCTLHLQPTSFFLRQVRGKERGTHAPSSARRIAPDAPPTHFRKKNINNRAHSHQPSSHFHPPTFSHPLLQTRRKSCCWSSCPPPPAPPSSIVRSALPARQPPPKQNQKAPTSPFPRQQLGLPELSRLPPSFLPATTTNTGTATHLLSAKHLESLRKIGNHPFFIFTLFPGQTVSFFGL